MIKGIDVAGYQPEVYSTAGLDFVFVKATEGRTYTNPRMSGQVATARSAGLVLGFYHFLWPGNINAQAAYFVQKATCLPGDILACDWESTSAGRYATCAEKDAFMKEVKRLRPDHRVVLYCNRDYRLNRDTSSYAGDGLWIADPSAPMGQPHISHPWLIHQYSDSGGLDRDVAAFDSRAAMRAWARSLMEDDMALTDAELKKIIDGVTAKVLAGVGEAVLKKDGVIVVPGAPTTNPTWTLSSVETEILTRVDALRAKIADVQARLVAIDPAALADQIEARIESFRLRLESPDA